MRTTSNNESKPVKYGNKLIISTNINTRPRFHQICFRLKIVLELNLKEIKIMLTTFKTRRRNRRNITLYSRKFFIQVATMEDEIHLEETVKASSAYHHYLRMQSGPFKEQLQKEGADTSMGAIVSAVASKWKSLSEEEQQPYEKLAKEDRERYEREKAIRDEEYLVLQEERRKHNAIIQTDTKMRGSTIHQSESIAQKTDVVRKKRELSEKEKDKISQKRQAKEADESAITEAHNELSKTRAEQAEARLKYLLSQSDIFSHFGAGKEVANAMKQKEASSGSTKSKDSKSSKHRKEMEGLELDEEEQAIAMEENDEEDGSGSGTVPHNPNSVMLLKQPSIIVGGAL
eukprot:gene12580-26490_t